MDVFVSYQRQDGPRVRQIVDGLRALGFETWMDSDLGPGRSFAEEIGRRVKEAKAVLVLWSPAAARSEWVRAEASVGISEGKLVSAFLEDVELLPPFNLVQTENLSDWNPGSPHFGWQRVIARIAELTGRLDIAGNTNPGNVDEDSVLAPGEEVPSEPDRSYRRPNGAGGKRVFIAHASADKQRLRPFVETLVDVGFIVWIDKPYELGVSREYMDKLSRNRIHYGADWKESIRKSINKCHRVLAFWSLDAVRGRREQFHYEVYQGLVQNKLRQCRIDKVDFVEIGFPYTFHHIADLSVVKGRVYHQAFQDLMADVARDRIETL